ncbi:hypothetical protein V6N11_061331 [Hibiscus sabdariffa]|uniref:Uncharacterized protein n=1 Tax=Hibiscus sabdariffa TaxID=183260 RepID=A0ABR2NVX5_9ROSI
MGQYFYACNICCQDYAPPASFTIPENNTNRTALIMKPWLALLSVSRVKTNAESNVDNWMSIIDMLLMAIAFLFLSVWKGSTGGHWNKPMMCRDIAQFPESEVIVTKVLCLSVTFGAESDSAGLSISYTHV